MFQGSSTGVTPLNRSGKSTTVGSLASWLMAYTMMQVCHSQHLNLPAACCRLPQHYRQCQSCSYQQICSHVKAEVRFKAACMGNLLLCELLGIRSCKSVVRLTETYPCAGSQNNLRPAANHQTTEHHCSCTYVLLTYTPSQA